MNLDLRNLKLDSVNNTAALPERDQETRSIQGTQRPNRRTDGARHAADQKHSGATHTVMYEEVKQTCVEQLSECVCVCVWAPTDITSGLKT